MKTEPASSGFWPGVSAWKTSSNGRVRNGDANEFAVRRGDIRPQDAGDVIPRDFRAGNSADVAGVDPERLAGLHLAEVSVIVAIDEIVDAGNFAAIQSGENVMAGKMQVVVSEPEDQG